MKKQGAIAMIGDIMFYKGHGGVCFRNSLIHIDREFEGVFLCSFWRNDVNGNAVYFEQRYHEIEETAKRMGKMIRHFKSLVR